MAAPPSATANGTTTSYISPVDPAAPAADAAATSSTGPFKILVIPGDHVGPEVMREAVKVLEVLEKERGLKFELTHEIAGGCSINQRGKPITQEVLDKALQVDGVLFGSVGGPEWGHTQPNPESSLLTLRAHMGAFANIRPANFYSRSLVSRSPLKREIAEPTNFIVLRENCGGAYYGTKTETEDYASDTWAYSTPEIERVARVGAALARTMGRDGQGGGGPAIVWSADKANVLANSRLWRRVVTRVFADEFPDVELRHQLADSLSMIMMTEPSRFNGVILTDNTFGDMLSDQAGGVIGTLGTLPSASLCGVPGEGRKCNGIYEPVHGSAPDISGRGIVNPIAEILSAALLLRYSLGLTEEALFIEQAVEKVLDDKAVGGLEIRTGDLGGKATTVEVGDAVCRVLADLLSGHQNGSLRQDAQLASPVEAHKNANQSWEKTVRSQAETGPHTALPQS